MIWAQFKEQQEEISGAFPWQENFHVIPDDENTSAKSSFDKKSNNFERKILL